MLLIGHSHVSRASDWSIRDPEAGQGQEDDDGLTMNIQSP